MIGESSRPRLAGIRPAPLCREDDRRSQKMLMASNLPSLARLGMFKSVNDAKSRFIHKHMRAATALAQASPEGGSAGTVTPLPRHWGGPPEFPRAKVSQPLAVMATEAALEDFRRNQKAERKRAHSGRGRCNREILARQQRSGASTSTTTTRRARLPQQSQSDGHILYDRTKHHHNHRSQYTHHNSNPPHKPNQQHQQHQKHQQRRRRNRPPSTHAVILPQGGGLVLVGEDGIRKSKFPKEGCERVPGSEGGAGRKSDAACEHSNAGSESGREEDVLTRLCNPKNFTGTAATGHLPTVVDLEGGVGVLLKGASTALKARIGAEEVSWRLRLAERL